MSDGEKTMTLAERLEAIARQREALEREEAEIYRQSQEAPSEEKVCSDLLAEMLARGRWLSRRFSWTVEHIWWGKGSWINTRDRTFDLAAVRPCAEEHEGKTFLGIYLGRVALSVRAIYRDDARAVVFEPTMHNPAFWVPAIGEIVMGAGSWWKKIETPEDLSQITDADIDSVWYVQALRSLGASHDTDRSE